MTEKSNRKSVAGEGRGRRQKKYCTNEGFGQGRGRNCNYRRNTGSGNLRPQSLVAAVFDGLDKVIERSKKTIALLSARHDPDRRITAISEKPLLNEETSDVSGDPPENTVKQIADRK